VRRILKGLNDIVGVRGSMVVSHDGMVIAACLGPALDEDRVAAIASTVVHKTSNALGKQEVEQFTRFTMTASQGKMIFTDTGIAYLVVVMDQRIDIGPAELEVESAARRIRSTGQIEVG
jgi:predicted regulator of Ras-like GTPase activity (Roadblock/LC7/MglB family)